MVTRQKNVTRNFIIFLMSIIILAGCVSQGERVEQPAPPPNEVETVSMDDLEIATGQVIFVPAYSEMFFSDTQNTWKFAITLAVHNTDLSNSIIVTSMRYYDTNGNLVREYVESPRKLGPLAKTGVVIERSDTVGGVGANFIVEWVSETTVTEPVVETVMISAAGTQGLSFISPGRVISQTP